MHGVCMLYTGSMLDLPYRFMGTAGLISDVEAGRVAAALVSHHSSVEVVNTEPYKCNHLFLCVCYHC
jgi:hypothetical protein